MKCENLEGETGWNMIRTLCLTGGFSSEFRGASRIFPAGMHPAMEAACK
jgi:hypothetical protein